MVAPKTSILLSLMLLLAEIQPNPAELAKKIKSPHKNKVQTVEWRIQWAERRCPHWRLGDNHVLPHNLHGADQALAFTRNNPSRIMLPHNSVIEGRTGYRLIPNTRICKNTHPVTLWQVSHLRNGTWTSTKLGDNCFVNHTVFDGHLDYQTMECNGITVRPGFNRRNSF